MNDTQKPDPKDKIRAARELLLMATMLVPAIRPIYKDLNDIISKLEDLIINPL